MNYHLKLIYKENIIKVKVKDKVLIKTIYTYIRTTFDISEDRKLILLNEDKIFKEDEELTEKEMKNYKSEFILLEEADFDKRQLMLDISRNILLEDKNDKNPLTNSKSKLYSSKGKSLEKNKKKNKNREMLNMIMHCTGANEKIIIPVIKPQKRTHFLRDYFHSLFDRIGEGEVYDSLDENDNYDEEIDDFLDENLFDEESNRSRSLRIEHRNSDSNFSRQDQRIFQINRVPREGLARINNNNNNNLNTAPHIRQQIQRINTNNTQVIDSQRRRNINVINVNYDQILLNILLEMGFDETNSRIALRLTANDLNEATHLLINAPEFIYIENLHLAVDNPSNQNNLEVNNIINFNISNGTDNISASNTSNIPTSNVVQNNIRIEENISNNIGSVIHNGISNNISNNQNNIQTNSQIPTNLNTQGTAYSRISDDSNSILEFITFMRAQGINVRFMNNNIISSPSYSDPMAIYEPFEESEDDDML